MHTKTELNYVLGGPRWNCVHHPDSFNDGGGDSRREGMERLCYCCPASLRNNRADARPPSIGVVYFPRRERRSLGRPSTAGRRRALLHCPSERGKEPPLYTSSADGKNCRGSRLRRRTEGTRRRNRQILDCGTYLTLRKSNGLRTDSFCVVRTPGRALPRGLLL